MLGSLLLLIAVPHVSEKAGHGCTSGLGAGAAVPVGQEGSGCHLGEVAARRKRKGRAELGPCRATHCLSKVTAVESV